MPQGKADILTKLSSLNKTRCHGDSAWLFPVELAERGGTDLEAGLTDWRANIGKVISHYPHRCTSVKKKQKATIKKQ